DRVLGHAHPQARRERTTDPSGEVPRRAGGRPGDHAVPGALPGDLADRDVRRGGPVGTGHVVEPAGPGLPAHARVGSLGRDAGQAGPHHDPSAPEGVRGAGQGLRGGGGHQPGGGLGRRRLGAVREREGVGLRRPRRGRLPRRL
ncbi:MAG: Cell division protein MraZ, partial [uncultured Friedmanniella sp.]